MSTATHQAKLSELQSRVQGIDADLKALDDEYLLLAGRFDSWDKHVLQQAAQLEERRTALIRDKSLAICATGFLLKQVEAEKEQEQKEADRRKLVESRTHVDAICALNTELDPQLQLSPFCCRRELQASRRSATLVSCPTQLLIACSRAVW